MMRILSDELLLDSYHSAVRLHLDVEFIRMLANELKRRGITPHITAGQKTA